MESGLFSELIITNPNPSVSLRWMVTSLGCEFWLATVSGGEEPVVEWTEFWQGVELFEIILELKSLLGELCWVEPGLRPFSGKGSPIYNTAKIHLFLLDAICSSGATSQSTSIYEKFGNTCDVVRLKKRSFILPMCLNTQPSIKAKSSRIAFIGQKRAKSTFPFIIRFHYKTMAALNI